MRNISNDRLEFVLYKEDVVEFTEGDILLVMLSVVALS